MTDNWCSWVLDEALKLCCLIYLFFLPPLLPALISPSGSLPFLLVQHPSSIILVLFYLNLFISNSSLTDFSFSLLSVTVHYFLAFILPPPVHPSRCLFLPSECVNAFALVVHPPTEQENLLFSFKLAAGEETVKSTWLRTLCRHVANTICRADAVSRHTHTLTHKKKARSMTDQRAGKEAVIALKEPSPLSKNKLIQS